MSKLTPLFRKKKKIIVILFLNFWDVKSFELLILLSRIILK